MSVTCRLILNPELNEHGNVDTTKREVGDMWFLDLPEDELRKREGISDQYWRDNSGRKPIVVMLPGRHYFLVDGKFFSGECTVCGHGTRAFSSACPKLPETRGDAQMPCKILGHHGGWTVTGVPPTLTVSPSIDMTGRWHGFLRDGVLSDA